jgi:hypothetical protein
VMGLNYAYKISRGAVSRVIQLERYAFRNSVMSCEFVTSHKFPCKFRNSVMSSFLLFT